MDSFKVSFPGNKRVDVKFKNFLIQTDQETQNGGEEAAPEPFTLFLAGLGACAGLYAKTFCETRNISTQGMGLTLNPQIKEGQKLMEKIEITLHVNPDFPEKYIKAVIKAMNACSVKNQINPELPIYSRVAYLKD
ncbi:MAG: OsmC family protein [Desulfobacter sp.]|nr:OsmC family protein [Desulfobacter sp.]